MKNERMLLLILAMVQFSHIVDFMIIMPLGATFMEQFSITPRQFSWIVSSYAFAAFAAGLVSSIFIDRFDRRKMLLFLYTGFTLGTLACAFAESYPVFLGFRALTGAFGGTLGALILVIVGDVIPLERRASAMGWVMTAFSAASIIGVPAGIYLAGQFGWRVPFLSIAGLSGVFLVLAAATLPPLRGHLAGSLAPLAPTSPFVEMPKLEKPHPLAGLIDAIRIPNQRRALTFSLVLILGHFTIIPFIAPYLEINIGFTANEVTLVYLIGGILSVFMLPLFGRLADRYGRIRVFTIASIGALFSIAAITNLPVVPVWVALVATSSFFVVASGRNVPATTLMTAVVRPENRGSFMSIRQSVNEGGLALSSVVAGFVITEGADGRLIHYERVGYLAIGMSIVALLLAQRLRIIA